MSDATYADWLNRSGSLTKGGLDIASQSPELQAALLMANQVAPNLMTWRNAVAGGDMTTPVTPKKQAKELGDMSIGAMEEAYRNRMAGWPQQQIYSNY